jgi:hypothetical protein
MTTLPDLMDEVPASHRVSSGVLGILLVLYLAIMSVDAIRKTTGLPGSSIVIIYAVTAAIYVAAFSRPHRVRGSLPRYFPLALVFLTVWCIVNALIAQVPAQIGLLGWSSYVFFAPLAYVGAEIMADDRCAARVLRVVAVMGGVVGVGTIASALLGSSAPALLQPIIPSVGVHTASGGDIYLAPSIFSDSEEACEQLLVSLFAWTALMLSRPSSLRRGGFAALGLVIFAGLIAAERRAGIDIAVAGVAVLLVMGTGRSQSQRRHARRPASAGRRSQLAIALGLSAIGSVVLIEIMGPDVIVSFLTTRSFGAPLKLMVSSPNPSALVGQGTGTATQGANLMGGTSFYGATPHGLYTGLAVDGKSYMTVEGGLSKTWLELGLIGVLLYGQVFGTAIVPVLRRFGSLDGIGRALLVLSLGLGILFLKGHQSLDDPLSQPLFWIAVGGVWGRLRRQTAEPDSREVTADVAPYADRALVPTASS